MKSKSTAKVFLTLMSLFLVFASSALAGDQMQNQKGIIDMINHEHHETDIIGTLMNYWKALWFSGEVMFSEASYKINHHTSIQADGGATTQADLDFWNDSKAQFSFSEKPVFISMNSVCGPAYNYVPEGVSEAIIMDNSGNALDSYTVTKKETGFTIQKGAPSNPDNSYTINLSKLEELDAIYGNIGQVKAGEMYIKEQIQAQE